MVGVLTWGVLERGFEFLSGQIKNYKIGNCSFSTKNATNVIRAKTSLLGIRIMCLSGATCLLADCSLSEPAQ